jgi:hypothetical protein
MGHRTDPETVLGLMIRAQFALGITQKELGALLGSSLRTA